MSSLEGVLRAAATGILSDLGLEEFDLGQEPPDIVGINVVQTMGGVAIDLEVHLSGDSNVSRCYR
jgi:hypothetical protein